MKLHDLLKNHWHDEIYEVKDSSWIPTEMPFFFIVKGESSINFVAGGKDHELRDPRFRTSETLYTPEPSKDQHLQPLTTETFTVEFKYEVYETTFSAFGREYRIRVYGNDALVFNGWVQDQHLEDLRKFGLTPRRIQPHSGFTTYQV